jgi:hypothetical protein
MSEDLRESPAARRRRQEGFVEERLAEVRRTIQTLMALGNTDIVVFSFVNGSRKAVRKHLADAPDLLERFERETEQMLAGLVFARRAFNGRPDTDEPP